MAEVYRAEQELASGITRQVAVKVIRPEYSESQDFREMFLDEARTACTLSHPNIVHIYEVGETDEGQLYMAMELVAGETLAAVNRSLRDSSERFADDALFAIGIWTAGALEAVHALRVESGLANLVHRDVSPHNLLLSSTGALKLIDFGIAKAATNRNLTMPGVTKGKAGYFSPEQAMGKKLDGRSDLFSLGVTLYKLAYGGTPFDDYRNHAERHAALVRGQWKPLAEVCPGLPQGFYDVVDVALRLKPEARFQTAREMRETLERAAFDAGLRVSQSTLLGYIDDDGDVTASGGSRSSLVPVLASNPPTGTNPSQPEETAVSPRPLASAAATIDTTEPLGSPLPDPRKKPTFRTEKIGARHKPPPKKTSRLSLLLGAFALAALIGVSLVLLLGDDGPTPLPDDLRPVSQPPPVAKKQPPSPPAVERLPDIVVAGGEELVRYEPPVPVEPRPVEKRRPPRPVKRVEPTAKPPVVEAPTAPAPPREESIPAGTGTLRISVTGRGARILVGSADWGETPVNGKLKSGWHRVTVKLPDGATASQRVAVWPDQTTALVYDAAAQKWR